MLPRVSRVRKNLTDYQALNFYGGYTFSHTAELVSKPRGGFVLQHGGLETTGDAKPAQSGGVGLKDSLAGGVGGARAAMPGAFLLFFPVLWEVLPLKPP